jgi:hypothetical protein
MISIQKVYHSSMFFFRNSSIILFFVIGGFDNVFALSSPQPPQLDSLPFFYERSVYLENLITPGAWWANPTCITSIDKPTIYTATVGLLGGLFSMSTVRGIFPVDTCIKAGFGVTGTGGSAGSSFNGSDVGAQASTIFSFSQPSFEGAVSYSNLPIGTIGALLLGGSVSIQGQADANSSLYYFWGYSLGWLSPVLLKAVQLSLSTLTVSHDWITTTWNYDAKAGVLVNVHDSLVLGSLEYGFPLQSGEYLPYTVLKGDVSIRVQSIVGILLGYGKDIPNTNDNGSTYHVGVELRRSNVYPFYGGYELGVSPWASRHGSEISLISRIWIGYGFAKKGS